jgi:hypothetical protein
VFGPAPMMITSPENGIFGYGPFAILTSFEIIVLTLCLIET